MNMATYSNSRLTTFEQCRQKYKFSYIDKIETETRTTVEAFMGDMVHQTLEKLYLDLKYQKLNSLKDILKFFNELWDKEWTDDILIVKKQYSADNYRKMGEKYITDYYNTYSPFNQMTIIGLETKDMMHLPDGSHYHVRIDKLGCKSNVYYVCDYKTNSQLKDQEEADTDRQLAMYSIWVKDKFKDAKKVVLLWHMLAFNKEVTSERSDKELKQLQKDTIAIIKEIEKCKEYPTNVTSLCNYCSYTSICPSFKHEVLLETKTVKQFKDDDGVKLVDEFSTLSLQKKEAEDKIEKIKDELVLFAKQKMIDIVYGSNNKASVKEFEKIVLPEDRKKFIALLKKKGLYEEFSMICYPALNSKILKGEIDKQIIKEVEFEKDFKVTLSKKKEEDD